jgi:putative ABC transport system substrate-binding protein
MIFSPSAILVMHEQREYPLAGGLMSYGASLADALRQSGIYVGPLSRGSCCESAALARPKQLENRSVTPD